MLIVDLNALQTVDLLDFADQVVLHIAQTLDGQDILGIQNTFAGDDVALLHTIAGHDTCMLGEGDGVALHHLGTVLVLAGDLDDDVLLGVILRDNTGDLAHNGHALGTAALEQLLNTGKTLGNILSRCNTAGMEGTHGQLGAGLADGLCCDDTDGLAQLDGLTVCHIAAVAVCADTHLGAAGQQAADLQLGDACSLDVVGIVQVDHLALRYDDLAGDGVDHIAHGVTTDDTLTEALDLLLALVDLRDPQAVGGAAVDLTDDDLLRNIDHAAGQVAGVSGTQSGIGQTLTSATGRNEIFQNVQTFAVVCTNGHLDGLTCGVGQQAAHAGQLLDLVHRTTRTGISHHKDLVVLGQVGCQSLGDLIGGCLPDVNGLGVTFVLRDQAAVEQLVDLRDLLICVSDQLVLLRRNDSVTHSNRDCRQGGVLIALSLDGVQHLCAGTGAIAGHAAGNDVGQGLFGHAEADLILQPVLRVGAVDITQVLRNGVIEDDPADGGIHQTGALHTINDHGAADLDGSVQGHNVLCIGHQGLVLITEDLACTLFVLTNSGQVVAAQDHILSRNGNRCAVRGLQQVAGSQHQHLGLAAGILAQGQVNCHLVTVEVGVECGTCQGVQLDGTAFDQHGVEGLNAQTVQGRCTVQQDRVALDHGLQAVPDLGLCTLDHLTGRLDVVGNTLLDQILHHEGLEQLQSHLLGQTALIHLQLRADDDNRTAGVVNTLAQQVLAEAALLALQQIGQALQGTVVGAGDRAAAAAVVDQAVNCFLQHPLLVAHDDVGSTQLQQAAQTVIAVDHAAVQVVQVGGGKTAAVQLDHGAQIGGQHGQHVHDHPLRAVAGNAECLNDLQTLQDADLLLAGRLFHLSGQLSAQLIQIDLLQQLLDGLSTHGCLKLIAVALTHLTVFLLGQQLLLFQRGQTGIGNDIACKVQDLLQQAGADVQHQANAAGDALEVPDVADGRGQLNVAHALTTNLCLGDLDTAAIADLALVADALVLAAVALPVLGRSKNALAVQAVALRLQGAVVDGLRLLDLAVAPVADLLRRSQADFNGIENVVFHETNPFLISS